VELSTAAFLKLGALQQERKIQNEAK